MAQKKSLARPQKSPRSEATLTTRRPRRLPKAQYKSFRLRKRIQATTPPLPSAWKIMRASLSLLKQHWKPVLGIALIYGLLNLFLVRGFSISSNLTQTKASLESFLTGQSSVSHLGNTLTLFGYLLTSSTSASGNAQGSAYQSVVILLGSLAIIWLLRQLHANKKVTVRLSFYRGMYPLVPFLAVLVVVGLQLVPLLAGSGLYNAAVNQGVATTGVEKIIWALLFSLLALLSLYMISSSLFALFIVTLPNMTPMKALRSARELVRHRRWLVLRKVLFLPLALLLAAALLTIPLLYFVPVVAGWIFFAASMLALPIGLGYIYQLYRELL